MSRVSLRVGLVLMLSLILTILPLPQVLVIARPVWVLLLLLYLQFYRPDYCNLTLLFILGLTLDILLSSVIGEHILTLTLVIWIASNQARRFYFFSIGQQMLFIGLFCLLYQLILFTIDSFIGVHRDLLSLFLPPVVSVLFWPWLRLMGEELL